MNLVPFFVFAFVIAYWTYCIGINFNKTRPSKTASDYFIANRSIPYIWFLLAATATSFSGWTFMSHPGMIFSHGFQASFISFYAIAIPLTGVVFLKRQWLLGKRFDFITPGDMFSSYFKTSEEISENKSLRLDSMKILIFIVALLFSMLYIAVQLKASGYLMNVLINQDKNFGEFFENFAMWGLAIFLSFYVLVHGFRRVAYVDQLQFFLLASGMFILGVIIFNVHIEGSNFIEKWHHFKEGLINLSNYDYNRVYGSAEYSHYFAIPNSIQIDVWNFNEDTHLDGWTGTMLFTFMLALMGIQASPAFTMWAFANKTPRAFAPQQVLASSLFIGFIMLIFTTIQGFAPHFLGANIELAKAHPEIVEELKVAPPLNEETEKLETDKLVPNLILSLTKITEKEGNVVKIIIAIIIAFLAISALAAMQSTASSYIITFGAITARDLIREHDKDEDQIKFGRVGSVLVVIVALFLASSFTGQEIALLGGLAVAYGVQMWPALVGICWWRFLTREGVIFGLISGLIVVTLTENPGNMFSHIFGFQWMRWPLTIHSAGWGLLANFSVAIVISWIRQDKKEIRHREKYHRFLRKYAALPEPKKKLRVMAWLFVLIWFVFAVGPGSVVGNDFFGNPNDPNSWFLGLVPIWTWQAMWWIIGVIMMGFLAYGMELSTMSQDKLDQLETELQNK